MFENLNLAIESLKRTNAKLETLNSILEKGEAKIKNGKFIINSIDVKTVYAEKATVSIGIWKKQGDRYPSHLHEGIIEYLICLNGSFGLSLPHGYRIINYKECASVPESVIHSVVALEDNSEMLAICLPAEEAYKRSMECQNQ